MIYKAGDKSEPDLRWDTSTPFVCISSKLLVDKIDIHSNINLLWKHLHKQAQKGFSQVSVCISVQLSLHPALIIIQKQKICKRKFIVVIHFVVEKKKVNARGFI